MKNFTLNDPKQKMLLPHLEILRMEQKMVKEYHVTEEIFLMLI